MHALAYCCSPLTSRTPPRYMQAYWQVWYQPCRPFYVQVHHRIHRLLNSRGRLQSEDLMVQRFIATFGYDVIIAYGATTGFHSLRGRPPSPTNAIIRAFDRARRSIVSRLQQQDKKNNTVTDTSGVLLIIFTPEHYTTQSCFRCGSKLSESEDHKRKKETKVRRFPHSLGAL